MDVEKRMTLSLDQIIQQKSGKGKQDGDRGSGKKGRGKVKIARLSGQVTIDITQAFHRGFLLFHFCPCSLACDFVNHCQSLSWCNMQKAKSKGQATKTGAANRGAKQVSRITQLSVRTDSLAGCFAAETSVEYCEK